MKKRKGFEKNSLEGIKKKEKKTRIMIKGSSDEIFYPTIYGLRGFKDFVKWEESK